MIYKYWKESPEWEGRIFTISENGIIKVRKFLSDSDIFLQPNSESVLNLMATIEAQAESELELSGVDPN